MAAEPRPTRRGKGMIWNIIDKRTRRYRWKSVNAIIEATYHDNTVQDSDEAPETLNDVIYDRRESVTLAEAVQWANEQTCPVTLYIYDEGTGTRSAHYSQTFTR
jgi:hypothetical protein